MKKIIVFISLQIIVITAFAQNDSNNNKIKFKEISFGTGVFQSYFWNSDLYSTNNQDGGLFLQLDLSVLYKKNIFKFTERAGGGIIFSSYSFHEENLLIEKEYKFWKCFSFNYSLGIGVITISDYFDRNHDYTIGSKSRIILPTQAALKVGGNYVKVGLSYGHDFSLIQSHNFFTATLNIKL